MTEANSLGEFREHGKPAYACEFWGVEDHDHNSCADCWQNYQDWLARRRAERQGAGKSLVDAQNQDEVDAVL